MTASPEEKPFIALGQYDWPKLPADDRVRLVLSRLKDEIFRSSANDAPAVANEELEGMTAARLDRIAAPPGCGKLLDEMTLTFSSWLDRESLSPRVRLVVLPPCDENNIVATWADLHGLPCLMPPARDDLLGETEPSMPDLDGDGVLIIPNLEQWFLRHRRGLRAVRALFTAISETDRKILVGCNSWAWAYLSSTMGAQLLLPEGMTFQAFDKYRLHAWFADLASGAPLGTAAFRVSESGRNVFETDEDDDPESDFFQKLAAHSLGIPWVAWSLWRRSLRETREVEEDADNSDVTPDNIEKAGQTIWIAAIDDFTLPTDNRQPSLLALQSLLIHGPLSVAHLGLTVPFVGQTNVVEALLRLGFVQLQDGKLSCTCAAYPAIRRELGNAGYSMDRL